MTRVEDALWGSRTGLLPAGDRIVSLLEDWASRGRDHVLPAVGLIDATTGRISAPRELAVADGVVVDRGPARAPGAVCEWFAAPGFVDAHAHMSSVCDLAGLLAYGVTGYRQMWGEPAHLYTAGVHRARSAVLPRPWVATAVVDGPRTRVPEAATIAADSRAVRHVVSEALAFGFDGIKVYDDLEGPVFAELVRAAEEAGVPVVGHVPERVPGDVARRGMRSTEHLYGIVPNVFRRPPSERWPTLAEALQRWESGPAAGTDGFDGHFVCPTLTAWRALTGERRRTRPSRTALRMATGGRQRSWSVAAREALRTDPAAAQERGDLIDRLGALTRGVADAGARLLVGTDCGNPFVVAGPSFHKELAELSRAGVGRAGLLRAATTEAHDVMGWRPPSDMVLYRRAPTGDVAALARPDGVLIDGVLLDSDDLDHLWQLRLAAAGLDAAVWPRGELDATGVQHEKEVAGAG
ncbi:hypothetical protein OOZ19_02930 [Saccharopolyspora sp. NFXS83]|uniref:hypothetical protein n=1 Tax=Saccharopolyspora sp. NFXS83 TaxID=2993560 RepID=UPI00224AEDA6|nr:hypothetical protein [Saccharopolyspora sp. NFXS83]MCX2729183.1 hypothetical protein [Saccharopolyspora sp. NFXS83]